MIELEVYLLFICCLIFTFLYEIFREKPSTVEAEEGSQLEAVVFGIFGSFCWIILSLVYFVGAAQQSRPYIISLFFSGIGIIYMVRWLIDQLNVTRWKSARQFGSVET